MSAFTILLSHKALFVIQEAIRDLTEEQEELRLQEEHELREDLDMNMNTVRQMERKLEASQETIIDQLQTIEKFRELVRHLQVQFDISLTIQGRLISSIALRELLLYMYMCYCVQWNLSNQEIRTPL